MKNMTLFTAGALTVYYDEYAFMARVILGLDVDQVRVVGYADVNGVPSHTDGEAAGEITGALTLRYNKTWAFLAFDPDMLTDMAKTASKAYEEYLAK